MSGKAEGSDHFITPSQLRVGLYIHLDLTWVEHPFTFSSFKIKNEEQISTIRALGLERIRFSPSKSDVEPLPPPAQEPPPPEVPAVSHEDDPAYQAKRERLERLAAQRAKVSACEREFLSTTRTIRLINQNVFAQPFQVKEQATELINSMADSMLVDADIAIQLMADKIGGEDVYHHSLNVTLLSMMLAKEMKAPAAAIKLLGLGALFHDVGEQEIPDRIVRKLEPMNRAELALFQQHCMYGVDIGKKLELPPESLLVIAQHHERTDGTGYPQKLLAPQLSLLARIVALVNAYDELCNPPNPAKAMTPHEALSILYAQQRMHFDPMAMTTFVRCMGVYPPGTIVVLSNGALGMVVSVNSSRPLKPTLLVYDPAVPKEDAILVDLEQEPDVVVSKTIKPTQLPQAAYDYLAPRKRLSYYFTTETSMAMAA
ncbi:HD-GYP domain-containing protein [Aquabacterium sp.]|uniref:HD-GYP domain-containing protein n=1 Tax=Aquabacterium sp. TaxID=1872578 RepID=UPI0035B0C6A0